MMTSSAFQSGELAARVAREELAAATAKIETRSP